MNRLREFLDANYDPITPVLLCGDFNVAPEERDVHDPRLWQNRILFSEPEKAALQHIKDWGFTDAFRQHTEEGGHYSWWDYRAGGFRRNLACASITSGFRAAGCAQPEYSDRQRAAQVGAAVGSCSSGGGV